MSYIGKTPTVGNFIKLDAITTSATASYTMQHGGVNFQPESALHMLVSLNGVIQSPNTSFTISGSTITFSSALTSSDSIDFIIVYGNVLDIGTPSDGTVTDAKANFVSTSSAAGLQIKGDGTTDGTLQLNCSQNSHGIKLKSPAHSAGASYTLTFPTTDGNADEFLKTDGSGALSWASAGGIDVAEQWKLFPSNDTTSYSSQLDFSSPSFVDGLTGSAQMTQSSGVFTFPSTGYYEIKLTLSVFDNGDHHRQVAGYVMTTTDNSSYSVKTQTNFFVDYLQSNNTHSTGYIHYIFDVTDTSTHKVKFSRFFSGSSLTLYADNLSSTVIFTRLGDT